MRALAPVLAVLAVAAVTVTAGQKSSAAGSNAGFDHRAHAVPGGPYSVLDSADVGSAVVRLSGANSHTHFFNPATGDVGRVTRFEWRAGGRVVCREMTCFVRFQRGAHRVTLTVWDSTGDVARATTSVFVLAPTRPGLRVLYYPRREAFPGHAGRPSFSATRARLDLFSKALFPAFLLPHKFSARVFAAVGFPAVGMYSFKIWCGGADCNLLLGGARVAAVRHGESDDAAAVTAPLFARKGRRKLEVVYVRRNPEWPGPAMVLWWRPPRQRQWAVVPAAFLTRNPAAYPPVVHRVEPPVAAVGSVISLMGSSFIDVSRVTVGGNDCVAVEVASEFKLTCVVPGGSGKSNIQVFTETGRKSNHARFSIVAPKKSQISWSGTKVPSEKNPEKRGRIGISADNVAPDMSTGPIGYYQKIAFDKAILKWGDGKTFKGKQMTAIAMGPDLKYYIGSLNGFIHVVGIDRNFVVKTYCKSVSIGYRRSILGVAFNPIDFPAIKLYASASILDWGRKRLLPFEKGWKNGQIVKLEPYHKKKGFCMVQTDVVITGLPVSNHDHGINSLAFNSWGGLLISAGGGTNAGVSVPGDALGGVPDSPLSGAMLVAQVQRRGFNGHIRYSTQGRPDHAVQTGGDVSVFATGLRNSMGHAVHSNGKVYATDNGSNRKYGARSITCKTQGPSHQEQDSLKLVEKGAYLGYANRNRGRWDPGQCKHRGPSTSTGWWQKPLTLLESSTNGIVEYTANTFGAQMRGDLLATKFAISVSGRTYRIQLNNRGTVKSKSTLSEHSGLTAALHPTGGVIMPRVYQGVIAALVPRERNPGIIVVTSVFPVRGPRRGGLRVTITGWNLFPPLKVRFGKKICAEPRDFRRDGRSFTCVVPAGQGKVGVVITRADGSSSRSHGWEFWYMGL